VTARDEAIDALCEYVPMNVAIAIIEEVFSDSVLVRLAIDRGALQPTKISISWAGTGPEVGRLTIDGIPTTKDTLLMYQIPEEKP
jgi:hypothetical protein